MPWPHALRSLAHRNLRLFFAGQCVSLLGSWMQSVAQGWLVYRLTSSTRMLGAVAFLAHLPVFLFGIWAGSLADRLPRRSIVVATQLNALFQATVLAALTLGGAIRPWHLLPLSFLLGLSYAFEIPARQSLLGDIAAADMPNAVALNSTIVNGTRALGPAVAGYVVAALGEGWCFALNALSFVATLAALLSMRLPPRAPAPPADRGHLADGLAYAWRAPAVRGLFLLLAASSLFGMPYASMLPALARDALGGDARLLGALQASAGAGALAAGIALMMRRGLAGLPRRVGVGASLLGGGLVGAALSPHPWLACASLVLAGFGTLTQAAGTMTLLQATTPPALRGRLMGLFSTLFVGISPFGALAMGFAGQRLGVPAVFLAGGLAVAAASAAFHLALPRLALPQAGAASAAEGAP